MYAPSIKTCIYIRMMDIKKKKTKQRHPQRHGKSRKKVKKKKKKKGM